MGGRDNDRNQRPKLPLQQLKTMLYPIKPIVFAAHPVRPGPIRLCLDRHAQLPVPGDVMFIALVPFPW